MNWNEVISDLMVGVAGAVAGAAVTWWFSRGALTDAEQRFRSLLESMSGPRYELENRLPNHVYFKFEDGMPFFFSPSDGVLLCLQRNEVAPGFDDGQVILLLVRNTGQPHFGISATLEGKLISIETEVAAPDSNGFEFFKYPLSNADIGKPQTIEVRFRTASGTELIHRYRTIHGRRHLEWLGQIK